LADSSSLCQLAPLLTCDEQVNRIGTTVTRLLPRSDQTSVGAVANTDTPHLSSGTAHDG